MFQPWERLFRSSLISGPEMTPGESLSTGRTQQLEEVEDNDQEAVELVSRSLWPTAFKESKDSRYHFFANPSLTRPSNIYCISSTHQFCHLLSHLLAQRQLTHFFFSPQQCLTSAPFIFCSHAAPCFLEQRWMSHARTDTSSTSANIDTLLWMPPGLPVGD